MTNTIDLINAVPAAYTVCDPTEQPIQSLSLAALRRQDYPPAEFLVACQSLPTLAGTLNKAQEALALARSHREYLVGAIAVMFNLDRGEMAILKGYNIKPLKGDGGDNLHAEQIAIAKGRRLGLDILAAISVIADPDDADANPRKLPTLPPCPRCTNMFDTAPEVSENTIVLGANLDLTVCELYSVGHLYNPYDEEDNPAGVKKIVDGTFALQTDADLDYFDHDIAAPSLKLIHDMLVREA